MPEDKKVDPILARYAPYYLSLGRFVQSFADAEVMTTYVLAHFAGTSQEVTQAIFSGTRGKDAISYVNRICEAKNLPTPPELQSAFAQFQVLTDARNTILHHGAIFHGDRFVASNEATAYLLPRTIRRLTVSPSILDGMAQDADTIRFRLFLFTMKGKKPLNSAAIQTFAVYAERPWLYKPPQQASPPRKTPDRNAKHSHQRQSSPKK